MKIGSIRYIGAPYISHSDLLDLVQMNNDHTQTYDKIIIDKVVYNTSEKQNLRSDNSYALLCNGTFVRCHKFFADKTTKTEKAIVKLVQTTRLFPNYIAIQELVSAEEDFVIDTNEIASPCNVLRAQGINYISPVPNKMHF